mmetsp:Transcript_15212/g.26554  ORF Transcript_15212/g.26554 Transcript_15212/m.26554 type:complete len:291 (-) Transcript_15212:1049-1921(-)
MQHTEVANKRAPLPSTMPVQGPFNLIAPVPMETNHLGNATAALPINAATQNPDNVEYLKCYLDLMNIYEKRFEELLGICRKDCSEMVKNVNVAQLADLNNEAIFTSSADFGGENTQDMIEELRKRFKDAHDALQKADQTPSVWRGNLPRNATVHFRKWAREHITYPYPSEEEKVDLCRVAQVSNTQLNNWFTNYRKRLWKQDQDLLNVDKKKCKRSRKQGERRSKKARVNGVGSANDKAESEDNDDEEDDEEDGDGDEDGDEAEGGAEGELKEDGDDNEDEEDLDGDDGK